MDYFKGILNVEKVVERRLLGACTEVSVKGRVVERNKKDCGWTSKANILNLGEAVKRRLGGCSEISVKVKRNILIERRKAE